MWATDRLPISKSSRPVTVSCSLLADKWNCVVHVTLRVRYTVSMYKKLSCRWQTVRHICAIFSGVANPLKRPSPTWASMPKLITVGQTLPAYIRRFIGNVGPSCLAEVAFLVNVISLLFSFSNRHAAMLSNCPPQPSWSTVMAVRVDDHCSTMDLLSTWVATHYTAAVLKVVQERSRVSPTSRGRVPLPRIFFIYFWSENGEFWCILGGILCDLELQKSKQETRYRPGKSKGAGSPTLATRPHFKLCMACNTGNESRVNRPKKVW